MVKQVNKQTLDALNGSIRKWQSIFDGIGIDARNKNCDLCKLFDDECMRTDTGEVCPIFDETNSYGCADTPYEKWLDHHFDDHYRKGQTVKMCFCPTCHNLAFDELNFLKSLLPKE